MDKLKMQTANKADENFKKLAEMFPNAVTETITGYDENGKAIVERAIDKDMLMQEISCEVVEGNEERYQFTWPDKKKSVLLANAPINKTLRPVRDDETTPTGADSEGKPYCSSGSVDFDNTENLYIEGDNLEVLKLLQETYLGKIKLIYIDPPYNTGNDSFVYDDSFSVSEDEFSEKSNQRDEQGNILFDIRTNNENNGKFHTDWLNMMYSRIKISKDLLSDDGVLVMSISDAEFHNLKKITDEIFGDTNYCGDIIWNSTKSVTNTALISVSHTYNLVYFKNINHFIENRSEFRLPDNGDGFENPDNDPRGPWKADPFQVGGWRPNQQYEITNPNTGVVYKPNEGCSWKNDYKKFQELMADNRIVFGKTGDGGPQRKRFIWEAQERGKVAKTLWDDIETTTNGTQLVKKMFDGVSVFDNPKPVGFLERVIELGANRDALILDFFSGSATTAHATMKVNAEDGGKRKFIMVQLPENTDEKSQARKVGYLTIPEIGKERIRRAAKMIAEEYPDSQFDSGFRVLKCDTSNMKEVYYNPAEYEPSLFSSLEDNIKEDRTSEDLLFQVMLDLGVLLSSKIEETTIAGKKVFNVEENYLIACFDDNVTEEVITEIAKYKPYYFVMRDSSMANDSVATNFEQIFAAYSPETVRKVL
uniref:site-specific DNA-methyltransferase n=1 Tax=Eubacterium sp. TaxID=142586 RepID=UPI003FEE90F6